MERVNSGWCRSARRTLLSGVKPAVAASQTGVVMPAARAECLTLARQRARPEPESGAGDVIRAARRAVRSTRPFVQEVSDGAQGCPVGG